MVRKPIDLFKSGFFFLFYAMSLGTWNGTVYAVSNFDLSQSSLDCSDFSRGAKKDAIPSIDQPKFSYANRVDYLNPDEPVIGVSLGGESRAYPLRFLLGHEVVNDQIGNKFIAVTYCPLCGTAMVFDRMVRRTILEFGVSGLLYKGDLVLYDRVSESLWSQLGMEALSGSFLGTSLTLVNTSYSTWEAWKKENPYGRVMSPDTGFDRKYERVPFLGAAPHGKAGFKRRARRADSDEDYFILGLPDEEIRKAYPLEVLAQPDGIVDQVGERKLHLKYDVDERKPQVRDLTTGEAVPFILARWYAWKAFYPGSERYEK